MNPEVSIIIPAHNTANYIARAIESALGQTLTNLEVIVVDDASSDSTLEVINSFVDSRLKVLVNQKNLGVSGARNQALKEAQGKWIAVLDSDDWYAPDRLEKLLQVATAENADIVIDDLHFIQSGDTSPWSTLLRQSGEQIHTPCQINAPYFVATGIYGQPGLHLGLSKPIIKREFLLKHEIQYDENMQVVEDFHLLLQCLVKEAYLIFVPQAYYFYLSRPGSLVTQSKVRHINQFIVSLNYFLQQDIVQSNSKLVHSLSKSLAVLEKNRAYYSVVEPLKQKRVLTALFEFIRNPYFLVHFISQLKLILKRRFRYYVLGDKLVYEISYRNNS
ncbi:glycosyltransferase family 2 protein [Nostoc cycadae]|uniref:Glycosyl transferase n=1 Tax=Nostoc cycadae WK-1 TaxID=1861711 RepID=A0A2H6LCB4_9NOSO|nr:glycosyltransferase family 2 protein [Nostoc cycadae]GBE90776.1 glycosyl transferase [Nostoc cycadae WK-1]